MKNILRISFCLLLFICITQVKGGVSFKSKLKKTDLVSSHQDQNQSNNETVFAEDTDDNIETSYQHLQYAETFSDLRCSNFVSEIIPNENAEYFSHHSFLIILHRTLRI